MISTVLPPTVADEDSSPPLPLVHFVIQYRCPLISNEESAETEAVGKERRAVLVSNTTPTL